MAAVETLESCQVLSQVKYLLLFLLVSTFQSSSNGFDLCEEEAEVVIILLILSRNDLKVEVLVLKVSVRLKKGVVLEIN
jgi:hypothetical protein